jgi:hypothetical protein
LAYKIILKMKIEMNGELRMEANRNAVRAAGRQDEQGREPERTTAVNRLNDPRNEMDGLTTDGAAAATPAHAKWPAHHRRICPWCGKDAYPTKEAACWAARRRCREVRLRIYCCPVTRTWHLTSKRPPRRRRFGDQRRYRV